MDKEGEKEVVLSNIRPSTCLRKGLKRLWFRQRLLYWIFFLPFLILMGMVLFYPLATSLANSFTSLSLGSAETQFIGLSNYIAVFRDSDFWRAMGVSAIYTLVAVFFEAIIGIGLALCLAEAERLRDLTLPWLIITGMISPVVAGIVWLFMLQPQYGLINFLMGMVGLPGQAWMGNWRAVLFVVIAVDIWQNSPFVMLLVLAGLLAIPKELYDAAKIDGASWIQSTLHITFPLLLPVLSVSLVMRAITAFKSYDLIYVMTKGSLAVTQTVSYYIYKEAFWGHKIGVASAASFIVLLMCVCMSLGIIVGLRSEM